MKVDLGGVGVSREKQKKREDARERVRARERVARKTNLMRVYGRGEEWVGKLRQRPRVLGHRGKSFGQGRRGWEECIGVYTGT